MKYIVPLGRLLFALIFITAAPGHFSEETMAYAASKGVPLENVLVPLSGIMAALGGLSIALGYHARLGAWLIVLFLVPVTPTMHNFWHVAEPQAHTIQFIMFMKNLSMLGGALLIAWFGAGPFSLYERTNR